MESSDIWNLIGLCLGTIGAVFLAYDVIYGAGKRFKSSNLKTQLENLRKNRKLVQDILKSLPQPPWTAIEIAKQLNDEETKWGPQETALDQEVKTFYDQYEDRVVTFGAFGVLLLVIGFALQIVGLVVHVRHHS